jgi:hypothetical protein
VYKEEANGVCNFSDCPCKGSSNLKYRTLSEEMIKGRFLNERK